MEAVFHVTCSKMALEHHIVWYHKMVAEYHMVCQVAERCETECGKLKVKMAMQELRGRK